MIAGSKGMTGTKYINRMDSHLFHYQLDSPYTSPIILSLLSGLQLDMTVIEPIFTLCITCTEQVCMCVCVCVCVCELKC